MSPINSEKNFLVRSIEEIHPDPYAYTDKNVFYEMKDELMEEIDHSMTRLEFYKKAAPLVALLGDGHTNIYPLKMPERGFPISVTIFDDNSVFTARDYDKEDIKIEKGSEILEINGIKATELVAGMYKYVSHGRDSFALAGIERTFPLFLYLEFGDVDEFYLKVKMPGAKEEELGIKKGKLPKYEYPFISPNYNPVTQFGYSPYIYRVVDNRTAVLVFDSFVYPSSFETFLKEMFYDIHQRKGY